MDSHHGTVETIFKKIEDLTINQTEIMKLKMYNKSIDLATFLIMKTISVAIIGLFLMFINIGISLWLGDLLGKSYYGFLVVGLFYALIAIFIHGVIYKSIQMQISNVFLAKILQKENV